VGSTIIKRLEIKGFKSFANKTELVYGNSFNCVLGPNGSGKSNILDALCFVLGKSSVKEMRAEKASSLIYNGGKRKNPAKEAEVSIYFDNTSKIFPLETSEVKVSRIIRSKEKDKELQTHGIYKINDKTRTRQQVLELLSAARVNPDGYNIILQGDIVQLVEMPPVQRRGLIEEISGISIYEDKKQKALRELEKVEQKLSESDIIMTERKTYLQELKKDRDQAVKFKELDDKIKRNKATMLDYKVKGKQLQKERYEKEIAEYAAKIEGIQKKINELKSKISEGKNEIEKINREIEQKGEKEQIAIHKQVEELRVSIGIDRQRIVDLKKEFEKINERKSQLQGTLNELKNKITAIEKNKKETEKSIQLKQKDAETIEQRIIAFKKKNKLDGKEDLDSTIESIDKQADALQEHITKLREEQQNLLREKDKIEIQLENIDQKIGKVSGAEKENKSKFEELRTKKDDFKKASMLLNSLTAEDASLAAQVEQARKNFHAKSEQLAEQTARNQGIKEGISGGFAIQRILEQKKNIPGIHGLVSELGKVKGEFSLALEVAAGQKIKSIVVENDKVAAECIAFLKEKKLGVATFLPLNKLRNPLIKSEVRNLKGKGIKGLALDLVSYDKQYEKVFSYVFENTLVVDDVDVARRLGVGNYRMATLTGDLVEMSGAMHGGYRTRSQGMGFQEKESSERVERLEKDVDELKILIGTLEKRRSENYDRINKLREEKANSEAEIIKLEKLLHLDSEDIGINKKQKEALQKEMKEIDITLNKVIADVSGKNSELANLKMKRQDLRNKINELKNPTLIAELNAFEEKKRELREEIIVLSGELKNSDSEITNILAPEQQNIDKILKQQQKEYDAFAKEKDELQKLLTKKEADLKENEEQEKKFYGKFKELFNKRTKVNDELVKLESNVISQEESIRSIEQKSNIVSLENAKVKAELAGLLEEFKIYEGVELFKNKSQEDIQKEIWQFEKMVQDIGAVNMRALEIYERVEKEYNELIEKKAVLGKEREDVLSMITEIDGKKKELFMVTFDEVNKNFKTIFSALSTKGDVSIQLEDEKDPFAAGLLIKVKIVGKKFLDIRSLSGGEKTLTALAFIFAVQEHDPAPFYIMDEVDAALDKRNSEKLAKLIQSYSKKAQYIIISHNDYMITEAGNLYGVSIDQDGISKVTTLKL